MTDVVFYAYVALRAGYALGRVRPIERWRRASVLRLLRFADSADRIGWRAWLVAIDYGLTHPLHSWQVWRRTS
jgi:hypothetical protein